MVSEELSTSLDLFHEFLILLGVCARLRATRKQHLARPITWVGLPDVRCCMPCRSHAELPPPPKPVDHSWRTNGKSDDSPMPPYLAASSRAACGQRGTRSQV